jgi:hypothetical protein
VCTRENEDACDKTEAAKLDLEIKRYELEKRRSDRESSFASKHAGLLITSLISVATLVVSWVQVHIAEINKLKELEFKQIEKDERLHLEKIKQEREWRLSSLEFLYKNREDIYNSDNESRLRLRAIISTTFPEDHVEIMFAGLAQAAPAEQRNEWELAKDKAYRNIRPKVYIHVKRFQDHKFLSETKRKLIDKGFYVSIRLVNEVPIKSDIRWYHKKDSSIASDIIDVFALEEIQLVVNNKFDWVTTKGYSIPLKTYEVWISES